MKNIFCLIIVLAGMWHCPSLVHASQELKLCHQHPNTANEYEILMNKIRNDFAHNPSKENIEQSLSIYNDTIGSFKDIDYKRDDRTNWPPLKHIERISEWVFAYTCPDNTFYADKSLCQRIVKGLEYWHATNPQCNNWWYNQIAEPQKLGVLLIQMRMGKQRIPDRLEKDLLTRMKDEGGHPAKWTGANRTDIALHWIYRACLSQDETDLQTALENAFTPIRYTTAEGFQYDNSYFQHGVQLYIGGYGDEILKGVTQIAMYTQGTRFQLAQDKIDLISQFMRETYYPTIRGQYMLFDVLGRGVSRIGNTNKSFTSLFARRMLTLDPEHKEEYETIIERLEGRQRASYGIMPKHTHYYIGDYTLHVRPQYTFDVRMVSNRTMRCEYGNNENLKTYFLSDGCTNIVREGNEYDHIFPVWDWRRIPGTTAPLVEEIPMAESDWQTRGTSLFAGGVSDSTYGATAYAYEDCYAGINTSAKKAWFFFDNEVVCLGADICSDSEFPITTTVNQCRLKNEVYASQPNGIFTASQEQTPLNAPGWVLHDGIGYLFPKQGNVTLSCMKQKGNWQTINKSMPDSIEKLDVMTLSINHGIKPRHAEYAYIVVPNIHTSAEMETYCKQSSIEILANTQKMQVVRHKNLNIWEMIFYEKGIFSYQGMRLEVSSPCAIILKKETNTQRTVLHIADPSQNQKDIYIKAKLPEMKRSLNLTASFSNTGVHAGATQVYYLK